MDAKNIFEQVRFAAEKMQKVNLYETTNFFCDVYCLEPGQEQKPHSHDEADKIYYVLYGCGTFLVGEEEQELGQQQIVIAPAGQAHGVRNTSAARLTLLVFMSPNPNFSK